MRILLRLLPRLLGLLVILAGIAVALGFALVSTSIPDAQTDHGIPSLSARVDITLDADGIPRIAAATERDAAIALGWLHARDRMFQMEAMRRGASGRLAEIAGPGALRLDPADGQAAAPDRGTHAGRAGGGYRDAGGP